MTKKLGPALYGPRLTQSQFRKWILAAEQTPTISLEDAKALWAKKRKELLDFKQDKSFS